MNLPRDVRYILDELNKNNFEAYVVGGCVRDSLLGKDIKDYDITTDAKPLDILDIFSPKYTVIPTGLEFGTVTVMIHHVPYEITTFRADGEYTDSRRPNSVQFSESLEEDVQRRDFTINALAFNTELIDLVNGEDDLKHGIIRCIGNPKDRFSEDALRILRALRFCAKYDFYIAQSTRSAMYMCKDLLNNISKERVSSEFLNIVRYAKDLSGFINNFYDIFSVIIPELDSIHYFDQNNKYHIATVYGHTLLAIDHYDGDDVAIKIALLFHDMGKPECYSEDEYGQGHFYGHPEVSKRITEDILTRLKFTNELKDEISTLVLIHDSEIPVTKRSMRKLLSKYGVSIISKYLIIKECDVHAHNPLYLAPFIEKLEIANNLFKEVLADNDCFKLADLAISGKDFIKMGYKPSKKFGLVLNHLLDSVISNKANNKYEELKLIASILLEYSEEELADDEFHTGDKVTITETGETGTIEQICYSGRIKVVNEDGTFDWIRPDKLEKLK